jgi:tyrosinase
MALNGPFGIYYFIGAAGGEINVLPENYLVASTLAAFSYNFTSTTQNCANCARHGEERVKITSTAVLTPMLIDYIKTGDLRSLDTNDVEPFLVDRLRWRVSTVCFFSKSTVCFTTNPFIPG